MMRPGEWHALRDCVKLEVYNCCFGVDLVHRKLVWTLEDPIMARVLNVSPRVAHLRSSLVAQLSSTASAVCERWLDALASDLLEHPFEYSSRKIALLVLILDVLGSSLTPVYTLPLPSPRRAATLVREVVTLLETQVGYGWTSEALAQRLGLTPTYFVRLFKGITGLPPLSYLASLRAKRAAELLMRTDLSIEHIALEVGWGSSSYFARRFKEHFGLSAREYRQKFVRPGIDLASGPRLAPRHPARAIESE